MKFPMEIDPATFKPEVGDKIETTYPDGSVFVGVVDRISSIAGLTTAYTSNGYQLYYSIDSDNTYRLLHRLVQVRPGGTIHGPTEADLLPPGTILEKVHGTNYRVVVLTSERGRYRYHRIDVNYAWPSISGVWKVIYLP